jgi:hypothetical protein
MEIAVFAENKDHKSKVGLYIQVCIRLWDNIRKQNGRALIQKNAITECSKRSTLTCERA